MMRGCSECDTAHVPCRSASAECAADLDEQRVWVVWVDADHATPCTRLLLHLMVGVVVPHAVLPPHAAQRPQGGSEPAAGTAEAGLLFSTGSPPPRGALQRQLAQRRAGSAASQSAGRRVL